MTGLADDAKISEGIDELTNELMNVNLEENKTEMEESELEFGDMPNGKIRFDKMKSQRDAAEIKLKDIEIKIARLEGKLEGNQPDETTKEKPEDYMNETELFLHKRTKNLETTLKDAITVIKELKGKNSLSEIENAENAFFENNPDLKANRQDVVERATEFLNERPMFKRLLSNKELSFQELISMVESSNIENKKIVKSNGSDYFSGESSTPSSRIKKRLKSNDVLNEAEKILESNNYELKPKAVDALLDANANYISSFFQ